MAISFNEIPSGLKKPAKYFEFDTKAAVRGLPTNQYNMCILAQKTAAGTATALERVQVYSDEEASTLFGAGSQCHLMARAAFRANRYVDLFVMPLDDAGAGTAAVSDIQFTSAATSSGVVRFWVGNELVEFSVANGDAVGTIAAALDAALDEIDRYLPCTHAVVTDTVTLTAKNKGTVAQDIPLAWETTATGVAATLTKWGQGALDEGATDPSIDGAGEALELLEPSKNDIIVTPYNDSTTLGHLETHIDFVSGPLEQRPSITVVGQTIFEAAADNYTKSEYIAASKTLADAVNHGRFVLTAYFGSKTPAYELAAAYASVLASETDPARPLNTLELKYVGVPESVNEFTRTQHEGMLNEGVATIETRNNEAKIVRAVTTYQVDGNSVPDPSLLDITTIRTLDYVRESLRQRISLRFARQKITDRVLNNIKSEIVDVLKRLEAIEIVENVDDNIDGIIVEVNAQDPNRVDAAIPCDVVNGLHIFAAQIQLIL